MASPVAYALPTIQFVCYLVSQGLTSNTVTGSIPAVLQSVVEPQLEPLPDGYIAYPDIGVAYKFQNQTATWVEARNVCARESAHLAVIDSPKKLEHIGRESPSEWVLGGIIRTDSTRWVNVNTGLPVPPLPWDEYQTEGRGPCAQFLHINSKLISANCGDRQRYSCEIPIFLKDSAVAVD